jgi:hypothetical protein
MIFCIIKNHPETHTSLKKSRKDKNIFSLWKILISKPFDDEEGIFSPPTTYIYFVGDSYKHISIARVKHWHDVE